MERPIGSTFNDNGRTLKVVETHVSIVRNGAVECSANCYYFQAFKCTGMLDLTGDCQRQWREDGKLVHFATTD